jgi:hypothetical protein
MRNCLGLFAACGLAACALDSPAEVRDEAGELPVRAEWTATLSAVGSTALSGSAQFVEHEGSLVEAETAIAGGQPAKAYQWRVFRGACSVTDAARLALWATVQSYPDLTTDAAGRAGAAREIMGAFRTDVPYSVRVRLAPNTTNWNGTAPLACGDLQRM